MSAITPDVLSSHRITASEYEKILAILGREPNITELGIFSVMWSEHCSYKSSKIHLKKLPTRSKLVVVGPGENAGIIDIGDNWGIAFKIESHNHPSFIEPFQGAATGVGGILRDIFTMGARPVAVMDALRFGPLTTEKNRQILEGVVSGISHYGNCFGVPTIGGETVFDECYSGNPLVNVFALGTIPLDKIFKGTATGIGNPVIYVGAKTGRDGIQGASMASAEFDEDSAAKRPNVQMGDPFMEKLLLEACLEAMETGAIVGIQDMGAAGLTCSTCEMGSRAETGIEIDLMHVPQREKGMTPYEIMLSESQERMLLVAEKGREQEVFDVFKKWGLDAVTIGIVTDDGLLKVKDHGVVVAEISNRQLADEAPIYDRPHTKPGRKAPLDGPQLPDVDHAQALEKILSSADMCSKNWIWEQYDWSVRTNTLTPPGGDAAVIRIKGAQKSVAMSLDGNGRYCYLDPREGTKLIVAECCRNLSVVGAEPVAATNNLNFGNPEKPEIMAQLVESIEALAEVCEFFETPITGGNVSLYNETLGEGIYPTPVIGIVGLLPLEKPMPMGFQKQADTVILLGGFGKSDERQFGSSQYAKVIVGQLWGIPPVIDLNYEKSVQELTLCLVRGGKVNSAHDLGEGGLAVALAEACFVNGLGVELQYESGMSALHELFHEGPSRVLVSTSDGEAVLKAAKQAGVEAVELGKVGGNRLLVNKSLAVDVKALQAAWSDALPKILRG
jgi:phosphoribosylformylglycinamidine synthase subunit PurL